MQHYGGVDVIAFAGGVGENGPESRKRICKYLEVFGIKLDNIKNDVKGKQVEISSDDSKTKVWIIPTNEEIVIARDAKEIITENN